MTSRAVLLMASISLCFQIEDANAQSVRVITLTDDSCRTFLSAVDANDLVRLTPYAGWAIGFMAGVAQGTNTDILRSETVNSIVGRAHDMCLKEPDAQFSIVMEQMARLMAAAGQGSN